MAELLKGRGRSADQGGVSLPVPRRRGRPRPLRLVALALALVVSLSAAGCAPPTSVTFTGRGFGHEAGKVRGHLLKE